MTEIGVKATYMGQDKSGSYNVNVKTANPQGNIGDAGVVRHFQDKRDAEAYAKIVNETGEDDYVKRHPQTVDIKPYSGDTFKGNIKNTKSGNEYKKTNMGKLIGALSLVGAAVTGYLVTSAISAKNLGCSFKEAAKLKMSNATSTYKPTVKNGRLGVVKSPAKAAPILALAGGLLLAVGLGLGAIVDACVNKVRKNKADKA
jgi:hypothetical protein